MIKKIIFVFALALCLQLISGCIDCNCGPVEKIFYTKKGLTLRNLDSSLSEPMLAKDSLIASAKYDIRIQFLTTETAYKREVISFGLISTAYACSCPEDDYIAKEEITSIQIFSGNDFDAAHPKNTDLSSLFKAKTNNSMIAITDFLSIIKNSTQPSLLVYYQGLFLQTAPSLNKKHKFRVKITLSDGRILEAETPEVELI